MERVETLINKLSEQYKSGAGSNALLITTQMLLQELELKKDAAAPEQKRVAVIVPAFVQQPQQEIVREDFVPLVKLENVVAVSTAKPEKEKIEKPFTPTPNIEELPTFAYRQKESAEVNNAVASTEPTLNDRLKTERKELGSLLKDAPVKDLKKAIGINDRFVFVDELFRGDENMYERSIKTINSFSILPEAEYWIQRELKVKLGWDETNETVQHFDQIVRRRFS